jgi:hypothetical protein
MRITISVLILAVAVLGVSGCGQKDSEPKAAVNGNQEAALKKINAALEECNALLSSMKSTEDANVPRAAVDKALAKIDAAGAELAALPDPSKEQQKLMEDQYGAALDKNFEKFATEVNRLQPAPEMPTKGISGVTKRSGGTGFMGKYKKVLKTLNKKIEKKLGTGKVRVTAVIAIRG